MVLDIMRIVDPNGVERRKRRRLIRRKYCAPGPNFIWHVDGYDKLKPFGFAVMQQLTVTADVFFG
jgi:hypothetical protein